MMRDRRPMAEARQRNKNLAIALVLAALVALFYLITARQAVGATSHDPGPDGKTVTALLATWP